MRITLKTTSLFSPPQEPGQVDQYKDIKVTYIRGHNPILYIFDDAEKLLDEVYLEDYNLQQLHEMVQSKGFVRDSGAAQ